MIRKAVESDLKNIMEIIEEVVEEMKDYGSNQWDENYPTEENFLIDIAGGNLYVYENEGVLRGFICIDSNQCDEYRNICWSSNESCMVIHRMAVKKEYRGEGIGRELMHFAEERAKKNYIYYLKTDTYSLNLNMNPVFKKLDYNFVGTMKYRGKKEVFNCYDKIL